MKTALLHYWLTNMRGGEKALSVLGEMLPDADIFTHALGNALRDDGEWSSWKGHRVTESLIARLPFGRRHPQAYLPLMPTATRALNLNSAVGCWETPFEAIKPGLCSGFAFHPMGER